MENINRLSYLVDKVAVSTSLICAVHCLFLPVFVVTFPTIAATIFGQEAFHQILAYFIIPISFLGLFMGCRKHKNLLVKIIGYGGLSILGLTAVLGHGTLGEVGEKIFTLVGSFAIATAHVRNYLLCQGLDSNS